MNDGVSAQTLKSISTPDRVESRLGRLEFHDGAPSETTADLLYEHLDFVHGVQAFLEGLPGASLVAVREGFLSLGVKDNDLLIFSELMDSASLFLTANCDTVYFVGCIDLGDGPMVLDIPPFGPPSGILGTIDDFWFRWVTDFGVPGPDRAQGGHYLLVGPDYDGSLPTGGFHVSHSRTTRVLLLGRAFMIDNDPAPAVKVIRDGVRIYPYVPGERARRCRRSSREERGSRPRLRSQRCVSLRGRARRSTRSRPTTTPTGRRSTSSCNRSPSAPATPGRWGCSRRSGSLRASLSSLTIGCARSSKRR